MRPLVMHVIPHLWSGAGGVLTQLCETQRRHGPVVLVSTGSGSEYPDWPSYRRRLRRAGVVHHTIDFFHRSEHVFWSSAARLAELIRDLQPAVVHAHAGVPTCGAIVARAVSGRPVRVIGQMYSWGSDRPEWMNQQDTWGFGQADRVVCSAHAYRELLVRYGVPANKLVYLPWGLPLDRLPWRGDENVAEDRAIRVNFDGPRVGFVGRIEPRKGQLTLVQAFARVQAKYPHARLELVGPVADKTYAARVRAVIRARGLARAVMLTGEVPTPIAYLRNWDVFVSLSSDEGQGLAVLEAMAVGVPVIARRVSGIADFLTDGRTGMVIADSTIRAAADQIVRAWSNRLLMRRIARQARRLVERQYSWDRTVAAFDDLYWRSHRQ